MQLKLWGAWSSCTQRLLVASESWTFQPIQAPCLLHEALRMTPCPRGAPVSNDGCSLRRVQLFLRIRLHTFSSKHYWMISYPRECSFFSTDIQFNFSILSYPNSNNRESSFPRLLELALSTVPFKTVGKGTRNFSQLYICSGNAIEIPLPFPTLTKILLNLDIIWKLGVRIYDNIWLLSLVEITIITLMY